MFVRIARLDARYRALEPQDVSLDDLVLRRGDRWVALSPIEARLTGPLIAHLGTLVTHDELAAAGWDDSHARSMRSRISGLRGHLAEVGLRLTTIRGRGF